MSSNPEDTQTQPNKGKQRAADVEESSMGVTDSASTFAEDPMSRYRRLQLFQACQAAVSIHSKLDIQGLPGDRSLSEKRMIDQALGSANDLNESLDKPFPPINLSVARFLAHSKPNHAINGMSDDEKWLALFGACEKVVQYDLEYSDLQEEISAPSKRAEEAAPADLWDHPQAANIDSLEPDPLKVQIERAKQHIDRTNSATPYQKTLDKLKDSLLITGFWISQQSEETRNILPPKNDPRTAWMITLFNTDPPKPEDIAIFSTEELEDELLNWDLQIGSEQSAAEAAGIEADEELLDFFYGERLRVEKSLAWAIFRDSYLAPQC
jgi:hypothetical protein